MNKSNRFNLAYVAIAVLGVFLLHDLWVRSRTVATLPYSEFQQVLRDGKIREITVSTTDVQGEFVEPKSGRTHFVTTRVEPDLARQLDEHKVKYSGRVDRSVLPTLLSWLVPILLFFAIWVFVIRRMAERAGGPGGLLSIGRSKAKVYVETDTKVSFRDVAGIEEATQELQEVVDFLKNPKSQGRLGGVQRLYSEETAREIDAAVRDIVTRCYARANDILNRNRALLEKSGRLLLARETLDAQDLAPLFGRITPPPAGSA